MTTGDFEREQKELPADNSKMEDISPETIDLLKGIQIFPDVIVLGRYGNYGFVELTTDEEVQEAFNPTLAGHESQSDTPNDYELKPYLTKSDMSTADVAAAIEKAVNPNTDPVDS